MSIPRKFATVCRLAAMVGLALLAGPALWAGEPSRPEPVAAVAEAKQILAAAGVQSGLIVHLGCGDGRLTAALRAGDAYVVHGLARNVCHGGGRSPLDSLGGA